MLNATAVEPIFCDSFSRFFDFAQEQVAAESELQRRNAMRHADRQWADADAGAMPFASDAKIIEQDCEPTPVDYLEGGGFPASSKRTYAVKEKR